MKVSITTCRPEDTVEAAKEFAAGLRPGDILRLHGEIGVGKTVFVRGLAEAFGCADQVCSPTFSIMNLYHGTTPVYHFDLYRMEDPGEIYEAGLIEYLAAEDAICVVEWPDLLEEYPLKRIYDISIKKNLEIGEDFREIHISGGEAVENTCDGHLL